MDDQTPQDYQHHFSRQSRRAMRKMAESLNIDWEKYPDPADLWEQIAERIAGGIPRANTTIVGDPFCLFVTFRCYNHDRGMVRTQTLVAKSRTGGPIDEEEGKKIIAQFLGSDRARCDECDAQLTEYSSQMTRQSVFEEQERDPRAKPMLTPRGVRETGPLKLS
jgi:hypothetical protein